MKGPLDQLFLALVLLIAPGLSQAQGCEDGYVDREAHLKICKESGWSVQKNLLWIVVKASAGNVTIYVEPLKSAGDTVARQIWQEGQDDEKDDADKRPMTVIKTEEVKVASVPAFLGITHKPPVKTATSNALEVYNIQVVFVHRGLKYVINNNCYREECSAQEQLVRDVAYSIQLIP